MLQLAGPFKSLFSFSENLSLFLVYACEREREMASSVLRFVRLEQHAYINHPVLVACASCVWSSPSFFFPFLPSGLSRVAAFGSRKHGVLRALSIDRYWDAVERVSHRAVFLGGVDVGVMRWVVNIGVVK